MGLIEEREGGERGGSGIDERRGGRVEGRGGGLIRGMH